ncbi:MAG: 4Fe-4S dicluster domain-containing protein [Chloroflexi bacterium]|nr:4Fe-4S dicluster domain-containing protein [Chloroflexota bacterium]
MSPIRRRDFVRYMGGMVGLAFLGKLGSSLLISRDRVEAGQSGDLLPPSSPKADGFSTTADPAIKYGMVIDVGACIGCRRCMWACQKENNTPSTISPLWIEVFELKSGTSVTGHPSIEDLKQGATTSYTQSPTEGRWYLPAQCFHCENPPCVKVCPTGATYKDADGLVLMDYTRCIGCRLCVVACPYSARRFNWWRGEVPAEETNPLVPVRQIGVVEKCTFCVHRVRRGLLPRCVEVCPVRARHFGNLNDPESQVSKVLQENLSFRLMEELNTGPSIRYITRGKKWIQS